MRTINGKPLYPFVVGDNNTGQCSSCGEVFYGERAFDSHRRDGICLDPANPPRSRRRVRVDSGTVVTVEGEPLPYWLDKKGRWHWGKRRPSETYESAPNPRTSTDLEPPPHVAGTITPTSLSTAV